MGTRMRDLLGGARGALRYERTDKRLRVDLAGEPVADTTDGLLVWEPDRVVPSYAVPVSDVAARLEPAHTAAGPSHTCAGSAFDVITGGRQRTAAAFRADDPDLADHVILDFAAFEWREEDEPIVGHPHDPYHRIDILPSSRQVRVEWDGRVLAESRRPLLLFETLLPVRFYLPRDDIAVELQPSDTVTHCAYKGRASYFSVPGGPPDLAWSYPQPLREAEPVRDRIAFFDERVDTIVDGEHRPRPLTPWSR
ncbi:DUF427 domain-containing protein [Mycobacterium sp. pUA109]|uniref:DUF427 domain-containing protein n=1 Tax=Mycobacterium sp. pUA109 TaxID=3238982 RepID=UPI00351B118D